MPDLAGKRVLDLGCGHGWFGKKFADEGARVTFVDGRGENLDKAREAGKKHIYYHMDIIQDICSIPKMDISLCLGLIYHVNDPKEVLRKAACAPILVVDSLCLDYDGKLLIKLEEDTDEPDYSLTGGACRPSPKWIVHELKELGYEVKEISVPSIEPTDGWPGAIWNWDYERTIGWRRNESQLWKLYVCSR